MFIRFDMTHERDRQTDTHTHTHTQTLHDGIGLACIASRGKNRRGDSIHCSSDCGLEIKHDGVCASLIKTLTRNM